MANKPTYEELEYRVKELENEAVKRKGAERAGQEALNPAQRVGMLAKGGKSYWCQQGENEHA